ncbi:MAG TPA: nicotinate phosphoribosyltransferase [Acidimicrobiia bacterium]|nr:nicotinate phosphoribosyltransferase [Acidimicrobiia bacterium]
MAAPLLTDLYELTMAAAYVAEGMAERPATSSLFIRTQPPTRGYLVAAGLGDVVDHLRGLRFGTDDVAALEAMGRFTPEFLEWLRGVRFEGDVRAVPEGRVVFAGEPLLEVDAPIGVAQLVETALLNQITFQTSLATKAARCRHAASGRAVVDFALRRTHGTDAGLKLARVARVTGLTGTSNVEGALRYGVPASGTMAHSFVQAYGHEVDAFRAFARLSGDATVLLVDTYDTLTGVERAIEVAREMAARGDHLRAIRLDSGDLVTLSRRAREMLDAAGLHDVQVLASGGLDEFEIADLLAAGAAIDGFGVGSALGVSADAPVLDSVYKLVAYDGRPVRKTSEGKEVWPGPKQVWRRAGWAGDVVATADEAPPAPDADPLLVDVVRGGEPVVPVGGDDPHALAAAATRFDADWAALPDAYKDLREPPAYRVEVSGALRALAADVDVAGH